MSSGYYNHAQNVGGVADKHAYLHATAPQLLNEMIQYADENEILRAKDQIIQKVIVEKGEVTAISLDVIITNRRVH